MAIFHMNLKVGNKRTASAKAKSDYILREGKYDNGREKPAYIESGNMPIWASEPRNYWQAADKHERENGRLYVQVEVALPTELNHVGQVKLCQELAQKLTDKNNLPFTFAIHADAKNPHCHLIISERINDGDERTPESWFRQPNAKKEPGAGKAPILKRTEELISARELWADLANAALERAERPERIDHRSHEARGLDQEPMIHEGFGPDHKERRKRNDEIMERNRMRVEIKCELNALEKKLNLLDSELAQTEAEQKRQRSLTLEREEKEVELSKNRESNIAKAFDEAWVEYKDRHDEDRKKRLEKIRELGKKIDAAYGYVPDKKLIEEKRALEKENLEAIKQAKELERAIEAAKDARIRLKVEMLRQEQERQQKEAAERERKHQEARVLEKAEKERQQKEAAELERKRQEARALEKAEKERQKKEASERVSTPEKAERFLHEEAEKIAGKKIKERVAERLEEYDKKMSDEHDRLESLWQKRLDEYHKIEQAKPKEPSVLEKLKSLFNTESYKDQLEAWNKAKDEVASKEKTAFQKLNDHKEAIENGKGREETEQRAIKAAKESAMTEARIRNPAAVKVIEQDIERKKREAEEQAEKQRQAEAKQREEADQRKAEAIEQRQIAMKEQEAKRIADKIKRQQNMSRPINPDIAYWKHADDVLSRFKHEHNDEKFSEIDSMIGMRMRVTGYSPSEIAGAIKNNAPKLRKQELSSEKFQEDYGSRDFRRFADETVRDFVFGSRGWKQFEKTKEYAPRLYKLEGRDYNEEMKEKRKEQYRREGEQLSLSIGRSNQGKSR